MTDRDLSDDDFLIEDIPVEQRTEALDDEEMNRLRGGFAPTGASVFGSEQSRTPTSPSSGVARS